VCVSREIAAPLETVFQTVSDTAIYQQAVPHIISVEILSTIKKGPGVRFRETRMMRGRQVSTELKVVSLKQNDHVRYLADAGGTIWDSVFSVTQAADGNGTLLSLDMEIRPHMFAAWIFNFFIRRMVVAGVEKDLDAVKAYCEELPG